MLAIIYNTIKYIFCSFRMWAAWRQTSFVLFCSLLNPQPLFYLVEIRLLISTAESNQFRNNCAPDKLDYDSATVGSLHFLFLTSGLLK